MDDADPNGHLRVGFTVPAPALNPHKVTSATAAFPYLTPVYDRLTQMVDVEGSLEIAPMVATEWEFTEDGRSAIFTLREGITFSDGAALDAEAVATNIDHAKNVPGSTVANHLAMIETVEAVDPTHVEFRTYRPAADLPYVLSGIEASLVSPLALDNPDLDVNPVGSGPYVATDVRVGDSVTYERRDGYWDEEAQLAGTITIRGIPDDNARLNALRSGQIDLMTSKIGQYNEVSNLGSGFGFHSYPASQVYAMYLNIDRPALSDVRVRQALNFAVDREGISNSLLDGQCTPVGQPLPPAMEGSLSDPPVDYTYDPDRARELLAEAGADNVTISALVGAGFSPQTEISSALRAQFADVGVTLNVLPVDVVEGTGRYAQGNEDAWIQVRVQSPSAIESLARNYTSARQFPGTVPPAVTDALESGFDPNVAETDRQASLQAASGVITEEALDVFICSVATQHAFSNKVIGVDNMGVSHYAGLFDLRYVGLAK